ncbi:hypothetical protein [Alteromonas abrolhosensis]|uniref:hypothetical protein n=1 Tax=Alteromonas abrolhosensis TaxID=1892904 RepID=UPI00096BD00C|nr:hypothetical protein [Alteromonas abrolhosensis]|tara:strand:- start:3223 stop:3579 length:357 start_codon:yes stop_codon:yes gene_type:complete
MVKNNANTGIIASGSIITVFEGVIQLLDLDASQTAVAASLAPVIGGLIAWFLNILVIKYGLPEEIRKQDAKLHQAIKLATKDLKCEFLSPDKKAEIKDQITEYRRARRILRVGDAIPA